MLIEYFGWYTNLDLVKTGRALCMTPDSRGGRNPPYCICGRLNEVFIAMLLYITYRLVNLACGHG